MTVRARAARSGKCLRPAYGAVTAALLFFAAGHAPAHDAVMVLTVFDQRLDAEIAATRADRVRGLSGRHSLPEDHGMLFVFRDPGIHAMWMRNTWIPLSVAFLDARGVIINIVDMEPNTLDRYVAEKPAKYALEVNRGWFDHHSVRPGMRIEGVDQTCPAEK